jgi:hypothetical protein
LTGRTIFTRGQGKTCVSGIVKKDGIMEKTEIYIHIGTGKTGTSAIQAFLNANRDKLIKNHDCLYPDFRSNTFTRLLSGSQGQHNHCPVFRKENWDTCEERMRDLLSWIKRTHFKKIVISCEFLMRNPEFVHLFSRVFQGDAGIRCVIIAYIRRQDFYYESAWKQWLHVRYENIQEYVERHTLYWDLYLDMWADAFGVENIVVHPYEKQQLPEGLTNDFLRIIGINPLSEIWNEPEKNNLNTNRGFTRDIIELMQLNRDFNKNKKDNRLNIFFDRYLPDCYRKEPFKSYSLLSPDQRIQLMKRYSGMNEYIARKYLKRSDGVLFYDPWPDLDEPWEAYGGLTIEKIVPIFIQIMYNMNKEYNFKKNSLKEKGIRHIVQNYITRIKFLIKSLNN